jgi:glycine cleavage system aminomethyltransferase T
MESRSARNVRRSPLFHYLKEKGAIFGASNGWERALFFDNNAKDLDYRYL